MKKPSVKATSAKNLEEKFDRGEEVLDYFDTRGAKVIHRSKSQSYVVKSGTEKPMVVREGANEWPAQQKAPWITTPLEKRLEAASIAISKSSKCT